MSQTDSVPFTGLTAMTREVRTAVEQEWARLLSSSIVGGAAVEDFGQEWRAWLPSCRDHGGQRLAEEGIETRWRHQSPSRHEACSAAFPQRFCTPTMRNASTPGGGCVEPDVQASFQCVPGEPGNSAVANFEERDLHAGSD